MRLFLSWLMAFPCLISLIMTIAHGQTSQSQSSIPQSSQKFGVWSPKEFPISFWCGPPDAFTTLERYQEIKEAGFTHVLPACGAARIPELNRKILDLCRQVGLKAFISDARMPLAITGVADAKTRLDAIAQDYKNQPALEGYHLTDEPGAGAFPGLAEVVAYLREKDPQHHAYINLFPNYAPASALGTPTYEEHVRRYLEQVKPFVLSYDHYHFTASGDGPLFFPNLATARKLAAEFNVHFWQIVLLVQHGHYRSPTEGELRYEAMQTLAYGGSGLLWFTYWQPDDPSFVWTSAMINLNGTRNPHYEMARRINGELKAFGGQLLNATSTAVFHVGRMPPGGTGPGADAPLRVAGKGSFTIGLFRDAAGKTLALITNADYRQPILTDFIVSTGRSRLQQFNPHTGRWNYVAGAKSQPDHDIMVSLSLSSGGAVLLRW